jgi:hypothetical protein
LIQAVKRNAERFPGDSCVCAYGQSVCSLEVTDCDLKFRVGRASAGVARPLWGRRIGPLAPLPPHSRGVRLAGGWCRPRAIGGE